jgi:hypothetical protein
MHSLTKPITVVATAVVTLTTAITALALTPSAPDGAAAVVPVADSPSATEDGARRAFAETPLSFEANRGQLDARSKYVASGDGFTLFLARDRAVFDLEAPDARDAEGHRSRRRVAVALDPVGADPAPRVVGRHRRAGTSSYFIGDPSRWRRRVPTFGRVRYRGLYPGVDMVFHGTRSGAEYDFVVAPDADPSRIGYRLRGIESLRLDHGDLVAATAVGDFVHRAPVAYQRIGGARRTVTASFRVVDGVIGFDVGSYDPSLPLVIDPTTDVEYATYLGGSGFELGRSVALHDGDAYIMGSTSSTDFPTTTGPYQDDSGTNVFVTRISPDGSGAADLVASAVLGGSASDNALGMDLDGGDAYVSGVTRSSDFPTTAGAFDETFNDGIEDTFFVRLTLGETGSADLRYATYLGGNGFDDGRAIAVDGGDAYLAGSSESSDYPTTAGAFDRTLGGVTDAVLTRISPDGAGPADLVYSTYFGGSDIDSVRAIAMDGGDAYITGSTWYVSDFPTTAGAYDRSLAGVEDAFLTRFSPDAEGAADLVYSTYLGGPSWDEGYSLTLADGDAYLVGATHSARFPTTAHAYDRTYNGDTDGFVARVSPDSAGGADLRYATFLGGGKEDWVNGVVVEGRAVYVVGGTESVGFPTTAGAYDRTFGGVLDGHVARIVPRSKGKADLKYSTFIGGSGWDTLYELAADAGALYVAGWTDSPDAPTTDGAYDTVGDADDAFLIVVRPPDNKYRPDGWIRRDPGGYVGDDIYNLTGEGQLRRTILGAGWRKAYFVTAQNDDASPDRIKITGPGSSGDWRVTYTRGDVDITRQVTGRGYRTRSLPAGGKVEIRVKVIARDSAPIGARKTVRVLLTSLGNSAFQDVVKAKLTVTQ